MKRIIYAIKAIYILIYSLIFLRNRIHFDSKKVFLSDFPEVSKDANLYFNGKFTTRDSCSIKVTSGEVKIGHRTFFNRNVSINCQERIVIGSDCMFGNNVSIFDHDHVFSSLDRPFKDQGFKTGPVVIGSNVWIGSGTIILKGVTIGDNVVIGASSLIKSDVPSNSIVKTESKQTVESIRFKQSN